MLNSLVAYHLSPHDKHSDKSPSFITINQGKSNHAVYQHHPTNTVTQSDMKYRNMFTQSFGVPYFIDCFNPRNPKIHGFSHFYIVPE